jgi:hypothetical protein
MERWTMMLMRRDETRHTSDRWALVERGKGKDHGRGRDGGCFIIIASELVLSIAPSSTVDKPRDAHMYRSCNASQ